MGRSTLVAAVCQGCPGFVAAASWAFAVRRCSGGIGRFTGLSCQTHPALSCALYWSFYRKRGRAVAFGATTSISSCSLLLSLRGLLPLCWSMDQNGLERLILRPDLVIESGWP